MAAINGTGERLRRATQLWHASLAATGQRFELALFLNDASVEKHVLDGALASGDAKLVSLAQEWMRDTGFAGSAPTSPAARTASAVPLPAVPAEASKKQRYLKGVR